jgi:hypothetical protein
MKHFTKHGPRITLLWSLNQSIDPLVAEPKGSTPLITRYTIGHDHESNISTSNYNNKSIPMDTSDGVQHSRLEGVWFVSMVRYSKEHRILESGTVSVLGRRGVKQLLRWAP